MKTRIPILLATLALLSTLNPQLSTFAQGTAFTYQGRLNDGSNPAQGIYDLRFTIYDLDSAGSAVGGPLTNNAVSVSNGLFTVTLDFGDVFDGSARWIEIAVRPNGSGDFSTLNPRQSITPAPYSIRSLQVANGAITSQALADGAVTSGKLAPGAVSQLEGLDGSPTNAVQVDTNGLVGIGTTTPEAGLHISGGAELLVPEVRFEVRDGTDPYTNLAGAYQVAVQGTLAAITALGLKQAHCARSF